MGLRAKYLEISDDRYKEIMERDDRFDMIYDLWDGADTNKADIDKMWDALHFLLTGASADHLENNLRSNMVVGHTVIDEENLLAYTSSAKVKEIVEEIAGINFTSILAGFDMQKCKDAEIYPDIWDDEEDKEDIMEDLSDSFDQLKQLYRTAAEHRNGVLVSIC